MKEILDYKGQKILRITDDENKLVRFQAGLKKCKLLVKPETIETIRDFIKQYDGPAIKVSTNENGT